MFLVCWFARLFYLPRLFVYHAMADVAGSVERFTVIGRRLYSGIMTSCMVITLALGTWLWLGYGFSGGWLHAKLALVAVLVAHHFYLGKLITDFKHDRNRRSHVFYRWLNEIPALPALIGITILVVVKPF